MTCLGGWKGAIDFQILVFRVVDNDPTVGTHGVAVPQRTSNGMVNLFMVPYQPYSVSSAEVPQVLSLASSLMANLLHYPSRSAMGSTVRTTM